MRDPLIVDGIPARITVHDFRRHHLQSFPVLADSDYDALVMDAIESVYAMFPFIHDLWDWQEEQVWYDKTTLCYRLLTAWFIADLHPSFVSGVLVMGGTPIRQKKIDATSITFQDFMSGDGKDLLMSLKSNPFGAKVHLMIKNAAKRALLRNRTFV